ncbi:MFS transporter [Alicyclobacillus tolerans]|uniref:CynX/NimT family MFS transporter n=1 Tax=Alicyclobacillus tolerans TaxID=90970 RepID=UPI001F330D36|nr:MFS transporter [Alicyclobacillus tolerans]MCF8564297.1 MFS transporter [Alicyclobacillus tolerans]
MQDRELAAWEGNTTRSRVLTVAGIVLVAFNLRPAITSVGPLIHPIQADLGLSNGLAGLITTLPLLAFGVLSPLAPKIGRKIGNPYAILLGLILLAIGIVTRSGGSIAALFTGTTLVGIGIAVCNVLLPGLVKHLFPNQVGLMTSVYATAMGLLAATASGVSIPLAQGLRLGWQSTLAGWALLAVAAGAVWMPQLRLHRKRQSIANSRLVLAQSSPTQLEFKQTPPETLPAPNLAPKPGLEQRPMSHALWRSPLAWQVTLFMGLQSFLFYCIIAWLPEILIQDGLSANLSGWLLSLMQVVGLPATFVTPILADRFRNQRPIVLGIGTVYGLGTALLFAHWLPAILLSVVLVGLGQGSAISLALALFGLRTQSAHQAAELSGMAQSIGYFLAATGPVTTGILFDLTGSWTINLVVFLAVVALMTWAGVGAGQRKFVFPQFSEPQRFGF